MTKTVALKQKVLSENDRIAASNRERLAEYDIPSLNLVSSPGSGKTSLLERTLKELSKELSIAIVAGDVQTDNDAQRLIKSGGRDIAPIVTGGACHLDARMIARELDRLDLSKTDLFIIENVGNLVCPSSYDLGENLKVVLISTTEGDDKPLKYPAMFRRSSVMVVNKLDLIEYSNFDLGRVRENALRINGKLHMIELSCRTEQGLDEWFDWLRRFAGSKCSGQLSGKL